MSVKTERKATYHAVIWVPNAAVPDDVLLAQLESEREALERDLTRCAVQHFGLAYIVKLGKAQPEASVRVPVTLSVSDPGRGPAVALTELRRFEGEIQLAIIGKLNPVVAEDLDVDVRIDEPSVEETTETSDTPWDHIAPVLAAIATGIGVLGFVTFVGGAIEWARFGATGLPREEALSVVPAHDLVVVGARTIVPAMAWGLAACFGYGVLRLWDKSHKRNRHHLNFLGLAADGLSTEKGRAYVILGFLVIGEAIGAYSTLHSPPGKATIPWHAIVLIVVLGLLAAFVAFRLARIPARFLLLALTIFLGLSIFVGIVEYVYATYVPALRGAAVIRNHKKATIGFFVAENSDRVYLARLTLPPLRRGKIVRHSARLIGIDKDQITDLAIGPAKPYLLGAVKQAKQLADEMCALQIRHPSTGPSTTRC
jgi:hypothetical protein